jgi:hypothetical protein
MVIREPYNRIIDFRWCLDAHLNDALSVRARGSVAHSPQVHGGNRVLVMYACLGRGSPTLSHTASLNAPSNHSDTIAYDSLLHQST